MNLKAKILISGSGGYIGSQLKYLISQKNIVTIGNKKNNKINKPINRTITKSLFILLSYQIN